jgi:hypothetical protein
MLDSSKRMLLVVMVVICGSAIAGAQTAPGTNRTPPAVKSAQPARAIVPAVPSTGHLVKHKPVPVDLKYWFFIAEKADDHESIQKEMRDNPNRFPPDIELRDMSMHIGIRPEEYAIILTHILDANDRLKENRTEWNTALSNFQSGAGYSAKSIPPPELTALGKEHDAIINGTIRSLKRELGDRSFHKLDTWVDLNYIAETSVPAPGTQPSRPIAPIDPVTGQAPAVIT